MAEIEGVSPSSPLPEPFGVGKVGGIQEGASLEALKGAKLEALSPEQRIENVINTAKETTASSVQGMARTLLESAVPKKEWGEAVAQLRDQYQGYREFVAEHGDWVSASHADPDKASLLQEQREGIIDSLVGLFNEKFGPELGIQNLGTAIFGTAGKFSDIDVGIRGAEEGRTLHTDQVVVARRLIDSLYVEVAGGLPGVQGDTEIYIPIDYRGSRVHSDEAKAKMGTLAMGQAIKQAVVGLAEHPEHLEAFKQAELSSCSPQLSRVKQYLFHSAEKAAEHKRELTLKQAASSEPGGKGDSGALYNARWLASAQDEVTNAQLCGDLERKEEAYARELGKASTEEEKASLQQKIDDTILRREPLWMELNSDQAESLFSQEAFEMTTGEEFGQRGVRKQEGYTKAYSKVAKAAIAGREVEGADLTDKRGRTVELSSEAQSELTDIITKGRMMSNLVEGQGLKRHLMAKTMEQVREKFTAQKKGGDFTAADKTTACQEVRAQMIHISVAHPGDAIATSKYGDRLARFDLSQLNDAKADCIAKGKRVPPKLERLISQTEARVKKAHYLERSKRATGLNAIATKHFLMEEIPAASKKEIDLEKLSRDLDRILDDFQPWGKHGQGAMKRSEILTKVTQELGEYIGSSLRTGKIVTGSLRPEDANIFQTLEAFAGYNREVSYKGGKHTDLAPKLDAMGQLTLDALGLSSPEAQDAYVQGELDASRQIQDLLTRMGLGPKFDLEFAMQASSFGSVVGNTVVAV